MSLKIKNSSGQNLVQKAKTLLQKLFHGFLKIDAEHEKLLNIALKIHKLQNSPRTKFNMLG